MPHNRIKDERFDVIFAIEDRLDELISEYTEELDEARKHYTRTGDSSKRRKYKINTLLALRFLKASRYIYRELGIKYNEMGEI